MRHAVGHLQTFKRLSLPKAVLMFTKYPVTSQNIWLTFHSYLSQYLKKSDSWKRLLLFLKTAWDSHACEWRKPSHISNWWKEHQVLVLLKKGKWDVVAPRQFIHVQPQQLLSYNFLRHLISSNWQKKQVPVADEFCPLARRHQPQAFV